MDFTKYFNCGCIRFVWKVHTFSKRNKQAKTTILVCFYSYCTIVIKKHIVNFIAHHTETWTFAQCWVRKCSRLYPGSEERAKTWLNFRISWIQPDIANFSMQSKFSLVKRKIIGHLARSCLALGMLLENFSKFPVQFEWRTFTKVHCSHEQTYWETARFLQTLDKYAYHSSFMNGPDRSNHAKKCQDYPSPWPGFGCWQRSVTFSDGLKVITHLLLGEHLRQMAAGPLATTLETALGSLKTCFLRLQWRYRNWFYIIKVSSSFTCTGCK